MNSQSDKTSHSGYDELRNNIWLIVRRDAAGTDEHVDIQTNEIMQLFTDHLKQAEIAAIKKHDTEKKQQLFAAIGEDVEYNSKFHGIGNEWVIQLRNDFRAELRKIIEKVYSQAKQSGEEKK